MVLMSDAFGVVTTRYAVGVTLIGEARVVRMRSVDVGAIGGWHHVAFGDLCDFHGILGGPAVFQPGGFDPSYSWLGLCLEWWTKGHLPERQWRTWGTGGRSRGACNRATFRGRLNAHQRG